MILTATAVIKQSQGLIDFIIEIDAIIFDIIKLKPGEIPEGIKDGKVIYNKILINKLNSMEKDRVKIPLLYILFDDDLD